MMGLKTFRLLPFCLLLLVNQSFSAGNSIPSDSDLSAIDDLFNSLNSVQNNSSGLHKSKFDSSSIRYFGVIQKTIADRAVNRFSSYKGKSCSLRIHLARDGTLNGVSIEDGSPDLCNKALAVINEIKKFPEPPSEAIYQIFKNAPVEFKP
ncbi:cell envelope integrity protein TolA [Salmonella enterica]